MRHSRTDYSADSSERKPIPDTERPRGLAIQLSFAGPRRHSPRSEPNAKIERPTPCASGAVKQRLARVESRRHNEIGAGTRARSSGRLMKRALVAATFTAGTLITASCSSYSPEPPTTSATQITATAATSTVRPTPTPTSSTPPTSGQSNTPTSITNPAISNIPEGARGDTRQAALAFTNYFISQLNRAWREPSPTALDGLFDSSCSGCVSLDRQASKLKDAGERHSGPVVSAGTPSVASWVDGRRVIHVPIRQLDVDVLDGAGKKVRHVDAQTSTFSFTLVYDGHWRVSKLQALVG